MTRLTSRRVKRRGLVPIPCTRSVAPTAQIRHYRSVSDLLSCRLAAALNGPSLYDGAGQ